MQYPRTERQARFVDLASAHAAKFAERADYHDRTGEFPFENFREMHESGYLRLTIPEELGGMGADPLEYALAQEALAKGDGSTATAVGMHLNLVGKMCETRVWPESVIRMLCDDVRERGALVNGIQSEPGLGSPSRGGMPSTTATWTTEGWRINGRKSWASLAPALAWMLVLVTTAKEGEQPTRSNFLVDARQPGISIEETWDNLGMRATASHDVVFDNVLVPHDLLLGDEASTVPGGGAGWATFSRPAVYLGIATAARDEAVRFAQTRVPNGMDRPIAHLQMTQHRIAEIEMTLWQARTLLYDTAGEWVDRPEGRGGMAWRMSAIKPVVCDAAIRATDLAVKVVGGASFTRASPLQRHLRDVRTSIGMPPMDDVVLTMVGKSALGIK